MTILTSPLQYQVDGGADEAGRQDQAGNLHAKSDVAPRIAIPAYASQIVALNGGCSHIMRRPI